MSPLWQNLSVSLLALSTSAVAYVGSFTTSEERLEAAGQNSAEARLPRAADGLFHVAVTIDGVSTRAILDTGASRSIIGHDTLQRLSLRDDRGPAAGVTDGTLRTIAGPVNYANVPVERLQVEGFNLGAIELVAVKGSTAPTVLGQDAIARFGSVTIASDEVILR